MKTLIHNAVIFTNAGATPVLSSHAVVIDGHRIAEISPENAARQKHPEAARLDAGGRLLMPGLINAHMHFYSTFARGLALPQQPRDFAEVLRLLWWKLDASLDDAAVYYSALLAATTAVRHGVTAVIDHHASPNAIAGSLDRIAEALELIATARPARPQDWRRTNDSCKNAETPIMKTNVIFSTPWSVCTLPSRSMTIPWKLRQASVAHTVPAAMCTCWKILSISN
ncbi:amidohydrolase family protein [candidate division KSB1 bacterium]|nr:amidohydrolase family protein [candidate division KSB1 bacterium]